MGLWFMTRQVAPRPQVPGQGSLHLLLMHALSGEHSELTRHSGWQTGGNPLLPGRHEHTANPFGDTRHLLFGPHGDGSQGFLGGTVSGGAAKIK